MQLIISRIGHDGYKETCLALRKICGVFIEVILRCLLYSIDTVSEFYDIEIDFHNPFFAPQEFHRQCEIEFHGFSEERAIRPEKDIFRRLLRNGTAAYTQ